MIKRLRIKFIITTVCALFCLMFSIFAGAYFYMKSSSDAELEDFLNTLIAQDGMMVSIPTPMPEDDIELVPSETMTSTTPIKWFSVKFDADNQFLSGCYEYSTLTEESAYLYSLTALQSGQMDGNVDGYQYKMQETSYGTLLVFADQRIQNGMLENLLDFIYVVTAISFLLLLLLSVYLSKLMVKPVEESFAKQKTFIADSGHELKTPLAIISANTQMLEQETGVTKYSTEINAQTKRMYGLVSDLLTLAKTEIMQEKNKTLFDFSKLVEDTALQFELLAFEMGKELRLDIENNKMIQASQEDITTLLNILLDNALKYGTPNEAIQIRLFERNRKAVLEITNQCLAMQEDKVAHIFDRFYRVDDARARETGGYGLGLSIAQNIVENHHGKITAQLRQQTELTITVMI